MSQALTSWKEIAAYVGKGVRTVQRWEREMGLPVRRPHPKSRQIVLALPEELDNWLKDGTSRARHGSERQQLKERVSELTLEIGRLRKENEDLIKTLGALVPREEDKVTPINTYKYTNGKQTRAR